MLSIACGFSLNDLLHEQKNNQYVEVTKKLIEKMAFYINCIEMIS